MATAEQIQHLKLVINAMDVFQPRESWPAPALEHGIPKGAMVEISGPAKYEWLIQFLKTNTELEVFWAEKEQQVLPTALHQRGLSLKRVTFGILGEKSFVSLRKIIQSQVFPVVVAPNHFTELKMFRAFQLLTEKSNNTLFLINSKSKEEKEAAAWPVALQLDIHKDTDGRFKIDILKQKFKGMDRES